MENNIEEAIKVMEHWIEYEKNNKEKINRADELINIQETILSAYKRVLKENEELKFEERRRIIGKYGDAEIHDVINKILSNDYIPVSKVKEKKEELDKEEKRELKGTKGQDRYYIKQKYMYKRKVLEELLREDGVIKWKNGKI